MKFYILILFFSLNLNIKNSLAEVPPLPLPASNTVLPQNPSNAKDSFLATPSIDTVNNTSNTKTKSSTNVNDSDNTSFMELEGNQLPSLSDKPMDTDTISGNLPQVPAEFKPMVTPFAPLPLDTIKDPQQAQPFIPPPIMGPAVEAITSPFEHAPPSTAPSILLQPLVQTPLPASAMPTNTRINLVDQNNTVPAQPAPNIDLPTINKQPVQNTNTLPVQVKPPTAPIIPALPSLDPNGIPVLPAVTPIVTSPLRGSTAIQLPNVVTDNLPPIVNQAPIVTPILPKSPLKNSIILDALEKNGVDKTNTKILPNTSKKDTLSEKEPATQHKNLTSDLKSSDPTLAPADQFENKNHLQAYKQSWGKKVTNKFWNLMGKDKPSTPPVEDKDIVNKNSATPKEIVDDTKMQLPSEAKSLHDTTTNKVPELFTTPKSPYDEQIDKEEDKKSAIKEVVEDNKHPTINNKEAEKHKKSPVIKEIVKDDNPPAIIIKPDTRSLHNLPTITPTPSAQPLVTHKNEEHKNLLSISQHEFIDKEIKMLLLPNDEIVLGKDTPGELADNMDFDSYITAYYSYSDKKYNALNERKRARDITKFLNAYYKQLKVPKSTGGMSIKSARCAAFSAIDNNDLDYLRALINNYPILQATNSYGNNLLHQAVESENYSISKFLIMRGINPTSTNNNFQTPLAIAESKNSSKLIKLLQTAKIK